MFYIMQSKPSSKDLYDDDDFGGGSADLTWPELGSAALFGNNMNLRDKSNLVHCI